MTGLKWVVIVQPPAGCGDAFDIPERSYESACGTRDRYRARGWKALVAPANVRKIPWFVRGSGVDEIQVDARSADEAIMIARAKNQSYDEVQRVW